MPPKRAPIIPGSLKSTQKSRKKKKRAIAEASTSQQPMPDDDDDDDDEVEVAPQYDALHVDDSLLSLVHEAGDAPAHEATGRAIVTSPDTSDKPERFFGWLVAPLTPEQFVEEIHERRAVHVARAALPDYYAGWFGRTQIDALLRAGKLRYTEEIDVTSYEGGERQTHNGDGVAAAEDVWRRFGDGCSVRLSWPQRHSDEVWAMVAQLEEYFGCGGGCNSYLTPAGCQGFAPHWDDVDAFILQVEGVKHWRIYAPRSPDEALPRFSSPNFAQDELGGEPLAEVTLRPGDLLYLPRGFIHQAESDAEHDSLHLTLSTGRQHTWRDLLQLAVEGAVEDAAAHMPEWRRSLPRDYLEYMGVVHADAADVRRAAFAQRLQAMVQSVVASLPLDAACDQFACRRLMHDRLPPRMARADAARAPTDPAKVELGSRIRLVARHAARLCVEGDVAVLYTHTCNTRVYHADDEAQHIDFSMEAAPCIEKILLAYPKYLTVAKLPADNDAQRLDIVRAMVEARLLLVRPPKADGAAE